MHNRDKKSIIKRLVENPIFCSGDYYQDLLLYLFDCHQKDRLPTEIDFAINVFGKKKDFDPAEDTVVRVYFYRLRKKLAEYYNGPGKHDPVRITIPKGHHCIEFYTQPSFVVWFKKNINIKKILPYIPALLLTFAVIYLALENNPAAQHNSAGRSVFWKEFLENERKTLIVIGELYTFYLNKPDIGHEWLVRDDQINSYEELQAFLANYHVNPADIYLPGWDIVPKSAAINILGIYDVLWTVKEDLEIKITSQVTLEDIREKNIIYVGNFHNLKHLEKYLPGDRFRQVTRYKPYQKHPERYLRVKTQQLDTTYQFTYYYDQKSGSNEDYALVTKVPGPTSNVFLFIVSFLPLGRLETIKMLTDEELLPQIMKEIHGINREPADYFEILIQVRGYEEQGFETAVKHFFPLNETP
ncbi:hypothetical protein JW935_14170 [candidate division KSB1 bacterium]|nr:hypothetical protein [candidate division KSB1 bacterium]